jgi:ABC-type multidrug transport system fused ATPase/permease subunit
MSKTLKATSTVSYKDLLITYLGPQWRRVLIMSILLLSGIALQLVNPQLLRYFIDTATGSGDITILVLTGALFIVLALLNQVVAVCSIYVSENVAWTATNQLRTDLVTHCLTLDMTFHKTRTAGELIERIDGDVNTLSNFFSRSIVQLCGNTLLLIGIVLMLFLVNWRVGIVLGIFALVAFFLLLRLRNFAVPFWTANRQKSAEFFGFLSEQLAGTEDLRANGATHYVLWRFYLFLRQWLPINWRADLASYTMFLTATIVFAVGNALAFVLGATLWSQHVISLGTVYLIFSYTNLLSNPMQQIRTQLEELQKAGAGITRTQQLRAIQTSITDGSGATLPSSALSVVFRDVTFGYNIESAVLHDISLNLAAGKVLGVLGRTGSGKTTLARLLLRLYDVQEGEILLGDVPIRSARLRDLRQRIGMVTQDIQLFHATVRDNLTFFNPAIPDERILTVLDDLGLTSWYRSLAQGLDTELGSDGEGLSAGEAQLLAFARVFLSAPGLVILDEASSRLDPATEQRIERAVSKLLEGRTGIIIAHRLATLQRADDILVLEDGRIVEYGSRESLVNDQQSRFYHLLQTGLEEILA